METKTQNPLTHTQIIMGSITQVIDSFLVDRKARSLSPRTIQFYSDELRYFSNYLTAQGVIMIDEITPEVIRIYLLDTSKTRNPGGLHASYRSIRAFLKWYWYEFEIEKRNPVDRVKPPRVKNNPLPGILLSDIEKLIRKCTGSFALRDRVILFLLVDTGIRAAELCNLNKSNVNLLTGSVVIETGKGGKRRVTYLGRSGKKAVRKYLEERKDNFDFLWITREGNRLTFSGLQSVIKRLAIAAGIKRPGLHDFRRAAALAWLRAGMSIIEVSRLLGHSSLVVTQRYLCLNDSDLAEAHRKASPGDMLRG